MVLCTIFGRIEKTGIEITFCTVQSSRASVLRKAEPDTLNTGGRGRSSSDLGAQALPTVAEVWAAEPDHGQIT